jgi:hypothetical protein
MSSKKLIIIVWCSLIFGCATKDKKALPCTYQGKVLINENVIKIVVIDSTCNPIKQGFIGFHPINMEVGTLDIAYHFPKYIFKIDSVGVTEISKKTLSGLQYKGNDKIKCFVQNDKMVHYFNLEMNDNLLILQISQTSTDSITRNCLVLKKL